jgi:hypothetical protein
MEKSNIIGSQSVTVPPSPGLVSEIYKVIEEESGSGLTFPVRKSSRQSKKQKDCTGAGVKKASPKAGMPQVSKILGATTQTGRAISEDVQKTFRFMDLPGGKYSHSLQ